MTFTGLQSFKIDDSIHTRIPDVSIGLIFASVSVAPSTPELLELIEELSRSIRAKISAEQLPEFDQLAAARRAYRIIGKDPSRYRVAAEALVRRLISGKPLYKINNVVEINNLVSLQCLHPVASYDAERIDGEVRFRLGHRSESYKGIGKEVINTEDLPVFADTLGAFGSPTSDSERTMIRSNTLMIVNAIMSFMGPAHLEAHIESASTLLKAYAGASIIETRIC